MFVRCVIPRARWVSRMTVLSKRCARPRRACGCFPHHRSPPLSRFPPRSHRLPAPPPPPPPPSALPCTTEQRIHRYQRVASMKRNFLLALRRLTHTSSRSLDYYHYFINRCKRNFRIFTNIERCDTITRAKRYRQFLRSILTKESFLKKKDSNLLSNILYSN